MTVPGVYSPEQGNVAATNEVTLSPEMQKSYDATIRAAAESDGVGQHPLVAFVAKVAGMGIVSPYFNMAALAQEARDALRALEGE